MSLDLEHKWGVPYMGRDPKGQLLKYIACKECGGHLGTVTIKGREIALPYPGKECPMAIVRFVQES